MFCVALFFITWYLMFSILSFYLNLHFVVYQLFSSYYYPPLHIPLLLVAAVVGCLFSKHTYIVTQLFSYILKINKYNEIALLYHILYICNWLPFLHQNFAPCMYVHGTYHILKQISTSVWIIYVYNYVHNNITLKEVEVFPYFSSSNTCQQAVWLHSDLQNSYVCIYKFINFTLFS